MQSWFGRSFRRLSGTTGKFILLMAGFLVLWGMLAPITTIVWWLNQTTSSLGLSRKKEEKPDVLQQIADASAADTSSEIDCYLVFLPGVGNFSPDNITHGQDYLIDQLINRHSNCVAVKDVFPYSVNKPGLDQSSLAPLWNAAKNRDGLPVTELIKIRNLWRFAISADDRYGPVYNLGMAHTIVERMNQAHPIARSDKPINLILMSTSGGTQVAMGATAHLRDWIDARITVVSIGGTFEERAGFNDVDHVYHLYSDQDWISAIPQIIFPGRWRWVVGSPFNQARRQGRYTACEIGAEEHDGERGYFGEAVIQERGNDGSDGNNDVSNNTTYAEQTLEQISQLPIWSVSQPLESKCPTPAAALD